MNDQEREQYEHQLYERHLAVMKEAGLKIDPETAEVDQDWGARMDPYCLFIFKWEDDDWPGCDYGRNYWARSPGSDVWVEFGDLPEATRDALWKRKPAMSGAGKRGDMDDDGGIPF